MANNLEHRKNVARVMNATRMKRSNVKSEDNDRISGTIYRIELIGRLREREKENARHFTLLAKLYSIGCLCDAERCEINFYRFSPID